MIMHYLVCFQMSLPDLNWIISGTVSYVTASKGLNVLIIAPDMSLPHPDAVARRSGQLTEEDKLKLQSQGLPPDCQDELAIVKTRCELDRKLKVTGVKSGKILREEAIKHIACLLRTTNNDGGKISHLSGKVYILPYNLFKLASLYTTVQCMIWPNMHSINSTTNLLITHSFNLLHWSW